MSSIRELIDLHYKNKLPHLSSTLTAYPIIKEIYEQMGENDVFILSQGHAALALYVVLGKGQDLFDKYGPHPHRDVEQGIYATTGSLGMGLTIAVGAAMAGKTVHVLISDGECAEGCVWEALNYIEASRLPIHVHVNANGLTALGDSNMSHTMMDYFSCTEIHNAEELPEPFLNTINDHYRVLSEEDYEQIKYSTLYA